MKSIENIVFTVVVAVFLCCTICYQVFLAATGTDQSAQESRLEGRYLQGLPSLSLRALASGTFQDDFEQYAADTLPIREFALEANARFQRASIDASDLPFGMEVVPTHYSSAYLYESDVKALVHKPAKLTKKAKRAHRRFARGLKRTAQAHPSKRFVVLLVAQSTYSESNEAASSCNKVATVEAIARIYKRILGDTQNVTISYFDCATPKAYFQDFFKTDNHWNIYGTAAAYNSIAKELGLQTFMPRNDQTLVGISFSGAWSRQGLYPLRETPTVEGNDFSGMTVHEQDGSEHDASWQTRLSRVKIGGGGTSDDFYVDFYGAKTSMWIDGLGPKSSKALLVGDSFAASFKYPLATQYGTVVTNWSLHGDFSGDGTFEDALASSGADDVFFVANPGAYSSLAKRYPNYWD